MTDAPDREGGQVLHLLDRRSLPDWRSVCGRPIAGESLRTVVAYTMDSITFRRAPKKCAPCGGSR